MVLIIAGWINGTQTLGRGRDGVGGYCQAGQKGSGASLQGLTVGRTHCFMGWLPPPCNPSLQGNGVSSSPLATYPLFESHPLTCAWLMGLGEGGAGLTAQV